MASQLFQRLRPVRIATTAADDDNGDDRHELTRVGSAHDGGYIFMNDIVRNSYDAFVSCGIGNDITFENDMLTRLRFDHGDMVCHAYDGTIDAIPECSMSKHIRFHRLNVGASDSPHAGISNLQEHVARSKDILLKMDIEGGEYEWIYSLTADDLSRFKQIIIEIHDPWSSAYRMNCVHKLLAAHHVAHIHANNYGGTTLVSSNSPSNDGSLVALALPNVFELTLVRKTDIPAATVCSPADANTYPTFLDRPNNPAARDHKLVFAAAS